MKLGLKLSLAILLFNLPGLSYAAVGCTLDSGGYKLAVLLILPYLEMQRSQILKQVILILRILA
jgi:hypothetical protein